MVERTGCDGVVVGRGCLGRPWLFADLAAAFAGSGRPGPARPARGDGDAAAARDIPRGLLRRGRAARLPRHPQAHRLVPQGVPRGVGGPQPARPRRVPPGARRPHRHARPRRPVAGGAGRGPARPDRVAARRRAAGGLAGEPRPRCGPARRRWPRPSCRSPAAEAGQPIWANALSRSAMMSAGSSRPTERRRMSACGRAASGTGRWVSAAGCWMRRVDGAERDGVGDEPARGRRPRRPRRSHRAARTRPPSRGRSSAGRRARWGRRARGSGPRRRPGARRSQATTSRALSWAARTRTGRVWRPRCISYAASGWSRAPVTARTRRSRAAHSGGPSRRHRRGCRRGRR